MLRSTWQASGDGILPAQPSQILALPQNLNSPAAVRYVYDEYQRLRNVLAKQVGREITDEAISTGLPHITQCWMA